MFNYIGRFAPSPTGPLHMGSLVTALASFLDAKAHKGKWLLRIEDVDTERCQQNYIHDIKHCLMSHGLQWQEPPIVQSLRHTEYETILKQLQKLGVVYACTCTRADIARHHQNLIHETFLHSNPLRGKNYPGTCKNGMIRHKPQRTWRIALPEKTIVWYDRHLKTQYDNPTECVGDLVLKHVNGPWAYALAVVADDAAQTVSDVVRGMDLKKSTSAQLQMFNWLGQPYPRYLHIPVLCDQNGRKLSKQNGAAAINIDTPLENLNQAWQYLGLGLANNEHQNKTETIALTNTKHINTNQPFQRINAQNPQEWLDKATQAWGLYLQNA